MLVGDSIMIAPVLEKGALERVVYLPEPMTEVRWNGKDFLTVPVTEGERNISVPLGEVVFFIRRGKLLPVGKGGMNAGQVDLADVTLLGDGKEYAQYLDDGLSKNCTLDNIKILKR